MALDVDHDGLADTSYGPIECTLDCRAFSAPDIDGDGTVGVVDLLVILGQWGPCGGACVGDVDGDGLVGVGDLLAVLQAWGGCK